MTAVAVLCMGIKKCPKMFEPLTVALRKSCDLFTLVLQMLIQKCRIAKQILIIFSQATQKNHINILLYKIYLMSL